MTPSTINGIAPGCSAIVVAAMTFDRLIVPATDRSNPPVMSTSVVPTAAIASGVINTTKLLKA